MMVCVWILGATEEAVSNTESQDVEMIYNQIRNSGLKYDWTESIVSFENEGMNIVCTLAIPKTCKKCPIVVILNGFGGDRNDSIIPGYNEPFFQHTSRILAEQGFASLRIDFRGSGDSDGTYDFTTFSTQISDTLAALTYIKKTMNSMVNTNSIGIIGFSQGGLVGSIAAATDKYNRVSSLVLWSPVANPPTCYGGLLTQEGIKKGLSLNSGESAIFGIYIDGQYIDWDLPLGKGFFEDIYRIDPVAQISTYKKPMMVITGKNDVIVWPQPEMGRLYLKYHDGEEMLIELDADHAMNYWETPIPNKFDDAIYWSTAWMIKTLKK